MDIIIFHIDGGSVAGCSSMTENGLRFSGRFLKMLKTGNRGFKPTVWPEDVLKHVHVRALVCVCGIVWPVRWHKLTWTEHPSTCESQLTVQSVSSSVLPAASHVFQSADDSSPSKYLMLD